MLTKYVPVKSGTGRYPNVNLNSISLYKGVFIQPLEDKFFILIKSDSDTAATSYKTTNTGSTALRQMSRITKLTLTQTWTLRLSTSTDPFGKLDLV